MEYSHITEILYFEGNHLHILANRHAQKVIVPRSSHFQTQRSVKVGFYIFKYVDPDNFRLSNASLSHKM